MKIGYRAGFKDGYEQAVSDLHKEADSFRAEGFMDACSKVLKMLLEARDAQGVAEVMDEIKAVVSLARQPRL